MKGYQATTQPNEQKQSKALHKDNKKLQSMNDPDSTTFV